MRKILIFIERNHYATPAILSKELGYSRQYIHRELNKLIAEQLVYRYDTPPRTVYLHK